MKKVGPAMRWMSAHALYLRRRALFALLLMILALQLAAGVGLAYVAGFSQVRAVLGRFEWPWIPAIVAALVVSFLGYYHAYQGTFSARAGWSLPQPHMWAVALAGYGGFVSHGATAVDMAALRAGGADEHDSAVHVTAFSGLEYGVLAIGGCGAAVAVLVLGLDRPPPSFSLPWAIIPLPGFLVAFWAARRFGDRWERRRGWRGRIAIFLRSIDVVRVLFAHPISRTPAVLGMTVFWAGDAFAAWAGLAAFGIRMNPAQLIVGFATGMVFTRRTGPLAGAGTLAVVLPVTIWAGGAPLAVAVPGIFVYHLLTLWVPMPASLATLRPLRDLVGPPDGRVGQPGTVKRAQ